MVRGKMDLNKTTGNDSILSSDKRKRKTLNRQGSEIHIY